MLYILWKKRLNKTNQGKKDGFYFKNFKLSIGLKQDEVFVSHNISIIWNNSINVDTSSHEMTKHDSGESG